MLNFKINTSELLKQYVLIYEKVGEQNIYTVLFGFGYISGSFCYLKFKNQSAIIKQKKPSVSGMALVWWTRRESNPGPNKELISFLHV